MKYVKYHLYIASFPILSLGLLTFEKIKVYFILPSLNTSKLKTTRDTQPYYLRKKNCRPPMCSPIFKEKVLS